MKSDRLNATCEQEKAARLAKLRAEVALRPSVQAAATVAKHDQTVGGLSLEALCIELDRQVASIHNGDLKQAESILMTQALTLNTLFNNLAQKALLAPGLDAQEKLLRLALKAQTQSRATLESLAGIKNPQPVAFIRQANVAHNQQINNVPAPGTDQPHAEKSKKRRNKLLERQHAKRLDSGTTSASSGTDSAMAPLGEVYRAQVAGGKGKGVEKR